jgi:hypothetical protein
MEPRPENPRTTVQETVSPPPPPPLAGAITVRESPDPTMSTAQQQSVGRLDPATVGSYIQWARGVEALPTNVAIVALGGAVGGVADILISTIMSNWPTSIGAAALTALGMLIAKVSQSDAMSAIRIRRLEDRRKEAMLKFEIAETELKTQKPTNEVNAEKLRGLLSAPNLSALPKSDEIPLSSMADFFKTYNTAQAQIAESVQMHNTAQAKGVEAIHTMYSSQELFRKFLEDQNKKP